MMRGGSFLGGFEIKPLNEQAMELPKPQDTKSIPESSSELGETIDLHDVRHEGIESAEKSASDIQKPLIDDNGNEITDKDGNLKPNITYSLFGIEYTTDDNGNIFCIDGEPLCNVTYVVDGHEYKTDDNGKVYCCDGVCISNDSYVIDGHRYYTDDNGQNYRIDNHLLPDCEYEVNGYKYHTDSQGRIISAEGTLKLQDPKSERHMENVRNYDGQNYKDTDDRGHLIGHQFGGSDRLENLIPQDAKINENDFRFFEAELAKAVSEGKEVYVVIEPVYEDDTNRPTAIVVTYSIDGETSVRIFPNSSEG